MQGLEAVHQGPIVSTPGLSQPYQGYHNNMDSIKRWLIPQNITYLFLAINIRQLGNKKHTLRMVFCDFFPLIHLPSIIVIAAYTQVTFIVTHSLLFVMCDILRGQYDASVIKIVYQRGRIRQTLIQKSKDLLAFFNVQRSSWPVIP